LSYHFPASRGTSKLNTPDDAPDKLVTPFRSTHHKTGGFMRGLRGKRIIVVGGASGIGAATVERLVEEGANVLAGDINVDGLNASLAKIKSVSGAGVVRGVRFDLGDPASAENLVQACLDAYGGVDGLANIGAFLQHPSVIGNRNLLQGSEEDWQCQFNYNLMGYARTIRAVLPHMIAQRDGAIVNTSSASAHSGDPDRPAYGAVKAALNSLTRHVAKCWGPDNIRCNSIAPGTVFSEGVRANMTDAWRKRLAALPLGRGGEPAELAAVFAFLLSEDAAWITGQVWGINGGGFMRE
jgi:NAD(P)-dependent dehydrogenase (short-subunit alcohol dehydrogenase family)